MSIVVWNCQGLRAELTIPNLFDIGWKYRPNVVFLMETKNKKEWCDRVIHKIRMEGAYYVEPNGISRGLALWWQKEVQLRVLQAGTS